MGWLRMVWGCPRGNRQRRSISLSTVREDYRIVAGLALAASTCAIDARASRSAGQSTISACRDVAF